MSRPLKPPSRADILEAELGVYDDLMASWMHGRRIKDRVEWSHWMAGIMYWPPYARNRVELSGLVLEAAEREGTFTHAQREWVDMVLATHLDTNVVMRTHLPDAIGAGVRPEAIAAVRSGNEEELTEEEATLADYIRRVVDGKVTDESFEAVRQIMGTRGVAEYTIFITVLQETMRQFQAFGATDPSDEEVDQLLADIREGRKPVPPDWRERAVGPWENEAVTPPAV